MPLLDDMSTTVRPTPGFLLTTTTVSPVTQMTQDCVHDDQIFADGALIKTEKACEHCYCMKGDIVCVVQECGAPMENEGKNCTSLPPREGQCCPDTYICEGDELSSELPTETTTESVLEKVTTLLPPRRTGVEGSGYRNEPDEALYTSIPTMEPEVEGSGDDHDTSKPEYDSETIPPTEDGEQFISVTKAPMHEDQEHPSTETDKNVEDLTLEPHDSVATTMSSIEKVTDKLDEVTAELKPHEHYTTTSPEKTSTEYVESLNTVPDEVHDVDDTKSHGEPTLLTTSEPTIEVSESTSSTVNEDSRTTVSSEKTEFVTAATSAPEFDTSTFTPEKEISDGEKDISRTTVAKEEEHTEKIDNELESSTPQPFISSSTNISAEEDIKQTTEPDHAQNTVAVAEEDTTDSHIPNVTEVPEPSIEGEKTTVVNVEQESATDKTAIDEVSRPSEFVPPTTITSHDGEISTEEPDKGLNTIPNEVNEESTSSAPHLVDTKTTEPETQDEDMKQTMTLDTATMTPDVMVTKGDQYTVTTEPSFRKEDEISVSTKKTIDFISTTVRPEFVDEGLIPTSTHDEKIGSSSETPSIEEDMTTLIPEYTKDMEETEGSKSTTPDLILDVSEVTEREPVKHSEPSADHEGETLYSTEKPTETTAFVEDVEHQEEPSRIPGEGDCLLNGVTFRNNSVVPSTNNCHTGCRCVSSIIKCDPIICSPPPDYMDNCQSIYDSPDACCPTYVCDHPRETVPPQSDNQMSGTESPLSSPTIECRGDQCQISEPVKQSTERSEPCTADSCSGETGPKSELPHTSPTCENEADCKSVEIPTQEATSCEGDSCKKVDCTGDNCDPNAIFVPDYTHKTPQDIAAQECTGEEPCRRKETSDTSAKIPSECDGPNCISEKEITTQDVVYTSTKSSIPTEEVTERVEISHEGKVTEVPETTKQPQETDTYTTEKQLDAMKPSKDDGEKEPAINEEMETKKPADIDDEVTEKIQILDDADKETPIDTKETMTEKPVSYDDDQKETSAIVGDITEKPAVTDDHDEFKPTDINEVITEKPVNTQEPVTDVPAVTDDYEKGSSTEIEEEITEKPSIIDDDSKLKPPVIDEDLTEKPEHVDEDFKGKPTDIDEKVTEKPVLRDEDGKVKPTSMDAEVTESPTMTDSDEKLKPTVMSEEITETPALTDDDGKEKLTAIDEEVTKKPKLPGDDEKETSDIVTDIPVLTEEGDEKVTSVITEELTEKPTVANEDDKTGPVTDEDVTGKPDTTDEDGKVKPTIIDEDVTDKPNSIDEDVKLRPTVVDEDVTGKPDMADEDGKEKPTIIDEDVTSKPDMGDEDGKVKPTIIDEDVTGKPDEDGKVSPPVIDEDVTGKPYVEDEDGKVKPTIIDEDVTGKPDFIDEDGKIKPLVVDEDVTSKPDIADDASKIKPTVIDEYATVKPELIDEDGKVKPTVINEDTTGKPGTIDEDTKIIPTAFDESVTNKPDAVDEEGKIKPGNIGEDATAKPEIADEDGKVKPTVDDDEVTGKPDYFDEENKSKPTVIDEYVTDKPDVTDDSRRKTTDTEEGITEKSSLTDDEHDKVQTTVIDETVTDKPSQFDDGKGKPTDTDGETTQEPTLVDDDKQPPVLQGDVTETPVLSEDDRKETSANVEDVTEKLAEIDEDGKTRPTAIDEVVSDTPSDTQEKVTEIPAVTNDDVKDSFTEVDVTMKPIQIDEDAKYKPSDADEEITKIPVPMDDNDKESSPVTENVLTEKPAVTEIDVKETQTAVDDQVTEKYSPTDDMRTKPTEIDEKMTDKPTLLDEDKIKSTVPAEETTKKPVSKSGDDVGVTDQSINEVTKTPIMVTEEGSRTELPEIERTKSDIEEVTPEISLHSTDSTSELQEVTKTPYHESTTLAGEDVPAFSTESAVIEPSDVSTSIPIEDLPSKTTQTGEAEYVPETPTKSQPDEATTMGVYETTPNVAITSGQDIEKETYEVTSPKQDIEEKPSTQATKPHDETASDEITTKSTLGQQEETSTDIPDLESLTTRKQGDELVKIEPQEGPEDDKHKQPESGLMEDEMTTKMYEDSDIKPVPESHMTDQAIAVTPESESTSDVTEHPVQVSGQPDIQDDKKTTFETSESDKPKDEEQDKTITETPMSSQDVSTEHQIPLETQKISEEGTTVKYYVPEIGATELPDQAIRDDLEHSTQPSELNKDKQDNLTNATEEPVLDITESQKDDEKTGVSEVTDQTHKGTTPIEEYTQEHEATTEEVHSKAPDTYDTPEIAESSTKSEGSNDSEVMPTEIPKTTEKIEDQTEPSLLYTESHDHEMKQPTVTEIQEQSTKLPISSEDSKTEQPEVQVTSETPQSLVTGHSETTISEKESQDQEVVTVQIQETTKIPELPDVVTVPEEQQTKVPIYMTEPAEDHDVKETATEDISKVTLVPEEPVTEKQETLTTLRESSPHSHEEPTEKPQVDTKPHETTESQTETSETTPDLIILEEHTHKTAPDVTTELPSENEVTEETSDVSPYEDHTPKVTEHIPSESPIDDERSTVYPGTEHQQPEMTTEKTLEVATKDTEVDRKPSEETPVEEGVTEKEVEVTVQDTAEDSKYTTAHKEYTTSAPTQVSEETTPEAITEPAIVSVSETGISESSTKEPLSSEKPTQETSVAEDEIIFSTTKATTLRQEEEISDDKVAKPEDRPALTSEVPPTSTAAEVQKPSITDTQPTEKIPEPEEEFPSTGPNGYGEPDYIEEDQAFGPGTCRYGGKVYVSAQQIPRDDPCDFCFCFRSDIICLQQSCPPPIHGCHEEPIQGFCCPRYECPVSMATTVNVTTTTTTTTTTLPPHFPTHSYKGAAQRRGCQIKGHTYKVGEVVRSSSGPCLHCT